MNPYGNLVEVSGNCMSFLIENGQDVTIRKTIPYNYFIGDIIVFKQDSNILIHRIIFRYKRNQGFVFITRGDGTNFFDKPVDESKILGKVITIHNPSGDIDLASPSGRFLSWFMGAYSTAYYLIFRINDALNFIIYSIISILHLVSHYISAGIMNKLAGLLIKCCFPKVDGISNRGVLAKFPKYLIESCIK